MKLRYPGAQHDASGKMKILGTYEHGFPQGAIVHFTAGGPNPVNTINGAKKSFCFFVIAPDGTVYQNFDLNQWGQHAGASSHPGFTGRVSKYFVGIEICAAGKVRQIDENTFRPYFNDPDYYKRANEPVPAGVPNPARDFKRDDVRYVERKDNQEAGWYHCYTPEQEKALEELLLWMKREAPGIFRFEYVLGHDEVSPGRKNDPGGALSMTMPEFRARLIDPNAAPPGTAAATPVADDAPAKPAEDSSEQAHPLWTAPDKESTHFGRILPNAVLRTVDGDLFLSGSTPGDAVDPKKHPFTSALDRSGQFAVVKGFASDGVLRQCSIVEGVPPIASGLLSKLLEPQRGLREMVLGIARETQDELFGSEPAAPASDPLQVKASGPRPLCVIDIGHQPSAAGAEGTLGGKTITEFDFNSKLAKRIAERVKDAEVIVISRDDAPDGYQTLPAKTNKRNPAFVISLHANGNGSTATGTEVLYYHASKAGKELAGIVQQELLAALGLRDRKIKGRTSSDRGGSQLFGTRAPIVIGEPFFITNPGDLRIATERKDALADAYARAIDTYAATLSQLPVTVTSARVVESHSAPGTTFEFESDGLTKEAFLARNAGELSRLIDALNVRLHDRYGAIHRPLTKHDAWVLLYCEAGLKSGGLVDPDHKHSARERGLLPLPENVHFWNGSDAPAWDKPMPLARNIEHFLFYLGNLKNKDVTTVGPRQLYRDLFRAGGIAGDPVREAKLLAGVVHGYFYSATYSDRNVPYDALLDGYRAGTPLGKLMKVTKYVHAGTTIMTGREKNIDAALALL